MARTSIGISSSVATFLLLTSVCCVLILFSGGNEIQHENGGHTKNGTTETHVPRYVPDIAIFSVMSTGILAMLVLIVKRRELTTADHESHLTRRHINHSKYTLYCISAFFIGAFVFDFNHLLVEFCCTSKWTRCDHDESEIFLNNLFDLIFHTGCMVFTSCETVVCWMMKRLNFKPSQWIWHGLAVIQAANIALWFDGLYKEAGHRNEQNDNVFGSYFAFCTRPTTPQNSTLSSSTSKFDACSQSSYLAYWYLRSIPILYPIMIEFSLLVSENFLDRSIGAESRVLNENNTEDCNRNHDNEASAGRNDDETFYDAVQDHSQQEHDDVIRRSLESVASEGTPLLTRSSGTHANTPNSTYSVSSKAFIMIASIINIVYLVICLVVFFEHRNKEASHVDLEEDLAQLRPHTFDNVFTVYAISYFFFLTACSFVGILSCRRFRRRHSHTSFLEYLLLFATSGVLLQSVKRIVAFAYSKEPSNWTPVYSVAECICIVQALLQIVLYYYAKDAKLSIYNGQYDRPSRVIKAIMVVMSISNFTAWIIDSFLSYDLNISITPASHALRHWSVFDHAVAPIAIFFRFNSALLFWCIFTHES